jgi:pimeloyl-ACP methyl ester carboxylesterase
MEPVLHHLVVPGPRAKHSDERRVAWWEWNATGQAHPAHVVVCVHGLSRQSRDFDVLAQALAPYACVVSVDVAGRGQSDWLADPMAYQVPTYATDLAVILAHLRQRHAMATGTAEPYALRVDWVGTSMGGLIGMALASQPAVGLRRLVLNDVGPVIEPQSLQRIGSYIGVQGGWTLHYDPDIAVPFRVMLSQGLTEAAREAAHAGEQMLWHMYDAIQAPTLLLRGRESDLLSHDTAVAMTQRGPRAKLVEIDGVGHAPTLVAADQVDTVKRFLLEP